MGPTRKVDRQLALRIAIERGLIENPSIVALKRSLFPEQLAFATDTSSRKLAALCSRRSGKSWAVGAKLWIEAATNAGCKVAYLSGTRGEAERTMWRDILMVQAKLCNIKCEFKVGSLTIELPNGSMIMLIGADRDDEKQKIVGQKFRLICIDEAQDWKINLEEFIEREIWPLLGDWHGTVTLTGTPSNERRFFYFVTASEAEGLDDDRRKKGWRVHRWIAKANPHYDYDRETREALAEDPTREQTPTWRQMWCGEWTFNEELLVYAGIGWKHVVDRLPVIDPSDRWWYVLGADTGRRDASAIVTCCYCRSRPELYVVDVWKAEEKDIIEFAQVAEQKRNAFKPRRMIIDPANAQMVLTLQQRFNQPWESADKRDKSKFMQLLHADVSRRHVLFVRGSPEILLNEMMELSWDRREKEKDGTLRPCEGQEDHATDAFLYAWRDCYHFRAKPEEFEKKPPPKPDDVMFERAKAAAVARYRRQAGNQFRQAIDRSKWVR